MFQQAFGSWSAKYERLREKKRIAEDRNNLIRLENGGLGGTDEAFRRELPRKLYSLCDAYYGQKRDISGGCVPPREGVNAAASHITLMTIPKIGLSERFSPDQSHTPPNPSVQMASA